MLSDVKENVCNEQVGNLSRENYIYIKRTNRKFYNRKDNV